MEVEEDTIVVQALTTKTDEKPLTRRIQIFQLPDIFSGVTMHLLISHIFRHSNICVTFHGIQVPRERLYINIPPVPQGPSRR